VGGIWENKLGKNNCFLISQSSLEIFSINDEDETQGHGNGNGNGKRTLLTGSISHFPLAARVACLQFIIASSFIS